jgi:uncharacterized membrane protein
VHPSGPYFALLPFLNPVDFICQGESTGAQWVYMTIKLFFFKQLAFVEGKVPPLTDKPDNVSKAMIFVAQWLYCMYFVFTSASRVTPAI